MSKRRIVVFDRVSADGYFSDEKGGLDWAVPDELLDREATSSTPKFDGMLFGRRTYDMFEAFWPHALDSSSTSPDPHAEGRRTEAIHGMAVWLNEAKKYVFSRTRTESSWKHAQFFRELDEKTIDAIRAQPGDGLLVFGSGSIVSRLTDLGLVDEYQLIVSPLLLGKGRQLVTGLAKRVPLELLEAKTYPSGNVKLRYARR